MKATKSEIIDRVSRQSPLNKAQIKRTLNLILDEIQTLLDERGAVELRRFGTFSTRILSARDNARNPRTGEKVSVKERRVPSFKPSREMRRVVSLPTDDAVDGE